MKKNLALLLSIVTLFSCIYFFQLNTLKDESIKGNQVTKFLYAYNLNENEQEWNNYYLKDKTIYFLLSKTEKEETKFELYKRDIYNRENTKLQEFVKKDETCSIITNYIQCSNNETITIYNYNLQELYKTKINENDDYPKIMRYKDIFIKYLNNALYLNQNNQEKEFRKLPEELKTTFVEDFYVTEDNTYLLLFNLNTNIYYIYDINKNDYQEIKSKNSYKYTKGFYFYDKNTYQILNLKDNKTFEYKNLIQNEYYYPSFLTTNNIFYYFNIIKNEIEILDLEKNILKKINLDIIKDNSINNINIEAGYLYFELTDNNGTIYLLDYENIPFEEINIVEEIKKAEEKLTSVIKEIKDNDNVIVHIKEDTNIKFPDFTAEIETNNSKINEGLIKINSILQKYNKEVFDSFYFNKYEGLHIYLTSKLTPSNLENQISNPAAYSLTKDNKFMIVIDINQSNIEELLCHELLHNIEFVLTKKNITPFSQWNTYNPEEFNYNNSYTAPYVYNYTLEEDDLERIYFIDKYSHTYAEEDRSRIFESVCACSENSLIKNYPNLYKKAKYIEQELYKFYPSLKETNLFDSLK